MFSYLFVLLPLVAISFGQHLIDGYIAYCPCMGRFGNQADHFLGALAFSKALNRTLIVPPWVEYRKGEMRSIQVPYETYFKLESLTNYHSVVSMETFIKEVASTIWPPGQRISFCYMERKSLNPENVHKDCYAKDGNPFGPFWDTFAIDFVGSEFFGPLHYDVHHSDAASKWAKNYPAEKWPVLAFTGAPGSFPVQLENRNLQKFVAWNEKYDQMANDFIKNVLPKGAFIGIHLRNGVDWVKACEHIQTSHNLFASPQCLGYNNERGNAYPELCMPSREAVIRQIKRLIKKVKETNKSNEIRSIFVASDNNHLIPELNEALARMKISAFKQGGGNDPHLDLAILGRSNHFIGNCVSSFSAFVKRERDVRGFPSYFWAFPKEKDRSEKKIKHEEL